MKPQLSNYWCKVKKTYKVYQTSFSDLSDLSHLSDLSSLHKWDEVFAQVTNNTVEGFKDTNEETWNFKVVRDHFHIKSIWAGLYMAKREI